MGDLAEWFRDYDAHKKQVRAEIEPTRFEYAVDKLMAAGYDVSPDGEDNKCLIVNGYIKFWPYTGWYSGKGVGSGRGIHNLIKKLGD